MAAEGFFGRWSQRKLADRKARQRDEAPPGPPVAGPAPAPDAAAVPAVPRPAGDDAGKRPAQEPPVPAPTMQDVAALCKDSDFRPFVARAVQPEVRNAAMKKLFSDPHFNVMDGLDTYIDDYARPDPLPVAMLRNMASAHFLNLFDDETVKTGAQAGGGTGDEPREDADGAATFAVAQSAPAIDDNPGARGPTDAEPTALRDDDTDLRLQPDDAAGPARAGRGSR